ncbi:MAG: tetratricopeptide repeat protein [Acidobacteria bacterium]|nr:tetratricopeptide repeat protein [Acidobacteriota bacterium]
MRYRFGELNLDLETGRLSGPQGELHLRPQAFRLLSVLVTEAPRVLSQDELMDQAWGTEYLSAGSIRQAVSELRTLLDDSAERPRYIATVHRRGYRFVAPVEKVEAGEELESGGGEGSSVGPAAIAPVEAEQKAPADRVRFAWKGALVSALTVGLLTAGLLTVARKEQSSTPGGVRPSLAVLPFANLGLEAERDWVGGAASEVVRFELATAGGLRLAASEAVARMGQELNLPRQADYGRETLAAVGANLEVQWVVAGSYLPVAGSEPGALLLQAQVQRTEDGAVLAWAQERCSPEELGPAASRLARSLQSALGLVLPVGEPAGRWLPDTRTLHLYSQAMELLLREEAEEARPLLEEAEARAPGNPLILDALGSAYLTLGFDADARSAAGRALESSDALPRSLRLAIEARALALDGRRDEAVARWQALWQFHPDDPENGLMLARELRSAGRYEEALRTIATLRSTIPESAGDPRISKVESDLLADLGDFATSRDRAQQSISEAAERSAPLLAADGYTNLAWALSRLGDSHGALAALERAEALSLQMRSPMGRAFALGNRAQVLQRLGRLDEAEAIYGEVLEVMRARGTRKAEAATLNNLAALRLSRDDDDGAVAALERSVDLKREIGDSKGLVTSLTNLATVNQQLGNTKAAATYLEEAVDGARQLGLPEQLAESLRSLAYLRAREGSYEIARALFSESLESAASEEARASAFLGLGRLARDTGDLEGSVRNLESAAQISRRLDHRENLAEAEAELAAVHLRQGDLLNARRGFEEALAIGVELEFRSLEAEAREGLGTIAEREGDLTTARREHRQALTAFLELGEKEAAERCRQALKRLGSRSSGT